MRISFRFKLGLLLLVIAIPFLVSQAIYRQTIRSLHDSLFSAVDVLATIHATESFHGSLHSMLLFSGRFAGRPSTAEDSADWRRMQQSTSIELDTLRDSLRRHTNHDQHFSSDLRRNTDEIAALYRAFIDTLDPVFSGPRTDAPPALTKAQSIFDEIFREHLSTLHTAHQQRLDAMKMDAHRLNQRIDLLFYGQTTFLVVVVLVALLFSEKILVRGYLRTKYESLSDGLTKAHNRRYLDTITTREAEGYIERKAPFALAIIDIDHFKQVNDSFGHAAGDAVLRSVADIVRSRLRKSDTLIRYGGEEFFVLLPGAEKMAAITILEKIRNGIESNRFELGRTHDARAITASAGLACYPEDGIGDFSTLMKKADERLYRAKNSGRNRVVSQDETE